MELKKRADQAVGEICQALDVTAAVAREHGIAAIVEQAMIDAVLTASSRSTSVVQTVCEHEMDMAHKLAAEIDRANTALITNLTGMRS